MANNLTNYGESLVLTYLKSQATHVGLFTTDPGEAGTGTEVSGGAYARQPITWDTAGATNSALITFPVATASWGNVGYVGLFNAASGGNMVWYGPLSQVDTVNTNNRYEILAGSITLGIE